MLCIYICMYTHEVEFIQVLFYIKSHKDIDSCTYILVLGHDSVIGHLKPIITLLHGKHGPQACEQSGMSDPVGNKSAVFLSCKTSKSS
ncbi:hypothetical protein L1987_52479 [Smallanthus sonchifolius]|uniref:Uncharacterized protein n=1 Tax=Smallanthus sonchifolius TaxID=185202 RepID=A0ACB9EUD6_9ASTR|nr:hypothetical protein L1987_52479 [Smallanthus sonchifolius]